MSLIPALLSLYILLKPFYLWSSGLPQISDFVLIFAFIVTLFATKKQAIQHALISNKHFFIFLALVIIINLFYSIYYVDPSFNLHTLYYIFDGLGIITFTIFLNSNQGQKHRTILEKTIKVNLLIQLAIFILKIGRTYGATRYMGTFNDPNQFAYFCFLSYGFIYLLTKDQKKPIDSIYFIIALFLIFESASTGMLIGMIVFLILNFIPVAKKILSKAKQKILPIIVATILIFSGTTLVLSPKLNNFTSAILNSNITTRIQEKFAKVDSSNGTSLWQERGYDRMLYYPQYLLFGAGEGNYARFEKAYHQGELHATLPSILFSYGAISLYLVSTWLIRKLKGQKLDTLCIYLALLIESFTLINSRQVLFWTIFLLPPANEKGENDKQK